MDIKGEVKLDGEKSKDCDTQGGKGPPIHMDCYWGLRKVMKEWNRDSDSDRTTGTGVGIGITSNVVKDRRQGKRSQKGEGEERGVFRHRGQQ